MKTTTHCLVLCGLILAGALLSPPSEAHDSDGYYGPTPPYFGGTYPGWQVSPPAPWVGNDRTMGYRFWGPWRCSDMARTEVLARRLDLDRKQRRALEDIIDGAYEDFRDIGEAMHDNRRQIERELWREQPDQDKIESLARKQGELMTRMILRRARLHTQILAELDDDQKDRYRRLRHLGDDPFSQGCRP